MSSVTQKNIAQTESKRGRSATVRVGKSSVIGQTCDNGCVMAGKVDFELILMRK